MGALSLLKNYVFVARLTQIIFGAIGIGISSWLLYTDIHIIRKYGFLEDGANFTYALIPTVALSALVTLLGGIGLFAQQRPNDIHWHLMLSLDWLCLVVSLSNSTLMTYDLTFTNAWELSGAPTAMTILSLFASAAVMVPIVRTHRLKRRGKLPPRNSPREGWYLMDDVEQSTKTTNYAPEDRPRSQHQPSQLHAPRLPPPVVSRAGTTVY